MPKRVLVTGGTGTLGKPLVAKLVAERYDVRVLSRREADPGVPYEQATGDLRNGSGLAAAVRDVDTVVHCATAPVGERDVHGTRALLAAAEGAGVKHLIYVSIVGVDEVPLPYYRTKLAVEGLLRTAAVPWTIQRATQFHDLPYLIFEKQRRLPVLFVPSGVPVQPIAVTEVADRLAALVAGEPAGRAPDLGGPVVRGFDELARAYLAARGSRKPVMAVRLPGRTFRAYRDGGHLAPAHAVGSATFEDFLAERVR